MRHSGGSPVRHRSGRQRAAAARAAVPRDAAGGAAAGPRNRRRAAAGRGRGDQLPYWGTLTGVAVTLALTGEHALSVRGGTLAVAGILLAAAVARLALPERRAGMLVSRRRLVDVAVLAALGAGLLAAGLVLPPQS